VSPNGKEAMLTAKSLPQTKEDALEAESLLYG